VPEQAAEPPMPTPPAPPELRAFPRRRRADPPGAPRAGPAPRAAPRPAEKAAPGGLPPIERSPRDGPLPSTFYQQWAWEGLGGATTADLNIPFAVRFSFPLSLPVLFASLRELERRQEGLRTRLVRATDGPWTVCQVVDPPGQLAVPLIDLSLLCRELQEKESGRLAAADAERPIDPAARPMFRAQLVRRGGTDHVLLCNLGHLIGDGWSVEILRGELAALYTAFAAGRPSPLPELPVQFADFAAWQRQIADGEAVARQLDYWRQRLAALPLPFVLPGDWPNRGRGTAQSYCQFSPAVTARIRGLARAHGATPAMVVLAAFGLLIAFYTGETDVVIESKVLGRPRAELAAVIGLFMNSLPHRTDLSGHPSFAEALRRTRDGVVEDYCNQDLPFPRLIQELFPGRRYLSRFAFNMLSFPTATPIDAFDREQRVFFAGAGRRPDIEVAKYDLLLTGHEDRDQLRLIFVGSASRLRDETVADIAADLEELVERALDEPGAPVARLLPAPRYRHAVSSTP
jgi:condensation domain-containing protein